MNGLDGWFGDWWAAWEAPQLESFPEAWEKSYEDPLFDPTNTDYFRIPFTVPKYSWADLGCNRFPHCETLVPAMELLDERCRIWSPEEIRECGTQPGPAMTPENIQVALEAGDESVAAYLRLNPDMAEAYRKGVLLTGGDPGGAQNLAMYAGLAALGLGVVLIMSQ